MGAARQRSRALKTRSREARLDEQTRERLFEEVLERVFDDREFAPKLRGTRTEADLRLHVEAVREEIWRLVESEQRACAHARAIWRRKRWRLWALNALRLLPLASAVVAFAGAIYTLTANDAGDVSWTSLGPGMGLCIVATVLLSLSTAAWRASARSAHVTAVAALERLREELYVQAVAPVARGFFPQGKWALTMTVGPVPGLADLMSERFEIPTHSSRALRDLLQTLRGGAVGVSGPRGAGKTTLIDSVCSGRTAIFEDGHIGVHVSAPVNYDARDFVVHLLSRTCEEVIDHPEGLATLRDDALRELVSRDRRRRMGLAWSFGLLFAIAAALSGLGDDVSAETARTALLAAVAGGFVVASYVLLIRDLASRQTPRALRVPRKDTTVASKGPPSLRTTLKAQTVSILGGPRVDADPARDRAVRLYQDAKLQQSYSSSWSGSLDLPLGASLGSEGSMTWAQVQLSLPELVEQLRGFLREVVEQRKVPIVIGIDELDKMRSSQEAQTFLNGIKSIFGVPGVHFLVSISQDAMSSFERRGLPFRDAFDSSFDEVVETRYLTLKETQRLLRRRVIGMPDSFHALCHCLSGAVPRDVIRVARCLVAEVHRNGDLATVATALVRAELQAKCRATAIAANGPGQQLEGRAAVLAYVASIELVADDDGNLDAEALLAACRNFDATAAGGLSRASAAPDAPRPLADLAAELNAFVRYCAVVLGLFGAGVTSRSLRRAFKTGRFERIAKARQGFVLDHTVAWARLDGL